MGRFFAFKSFSAQILFVCQKLEMLPFFDGTYTLPQRYADWKALYMHQMRLYLVHTLKVDDVSSHRIACSLANVVDCVQREHRRLPRTLQCREEYKDDNVRQSEQIKPLAT